MNIYLHRVVKGYLLVKIACGTLGAYGFFLVFSAPCLHGDRSTRAAAHFFAAHGFASASMPAIAERSGITAGAIYRHFKSKAELLLEVVKRALEALPLSFERSRGADDAALLP